jgi:hypothetical protein
VFRQYLRGFDPVNSEKSNAVAQLVPDQQIPYWPIEEEEMRFDGTPGSRHFLVFIGDGEIFPVEEGFMDRGEAA